MDRLGTDQGDKVLGMPAHSLFKKIECLVETIHPP
jgi:hypothetical protein